MYRHKTCVKYPLEVATATSMPACVCIAKSASREIVLPFTFVMAMTLAPLLLARRSAAMVSAVSPDWLMTMNRSSGLSSGDGMR